MCKSKQAEDLRLTEKRGRDKTEKNNFIIKNKKKSKSIFFECMHSHKLHYHWNSPHLAITPGDIFDLAINRFPPQLFRYSHLFEGKKSMMTSVALWGLWDVCVHVHRCVHTSVSVLLLYLHEGLVFLCVPFPRKNSDAFSSPEMETKPSAVLGM